MKLPVHCPFTFIRLTAFCCSCVAGGGGGGGLQCANSQPRRSMYTVNNFSNACKNSLTYDLFIAF